MSLLPWDSLKNQVDALWAVSQFDDQYIDLTYELFSRMGQQLVEDVPRLNHVGMKLPKRFDEIPTINRVGVVFKKAKRIKSNPKKIIVSRSTEEQHDSQLHVVKCSGIYWFRFINWYCRQHGKQIVVPNQAILDRVSMTIGQQPGETLDRYVAAIGSIRPQSSQSYEIQFVRSLIFVSSIACQGLRQYQEKQIDEKKQCILRILLDLGADSPSKLRGLSANRDKCPTKKLLYKKLGGKKPQPDGAFNKTIDQLIDSGLIINGRKEAKCYGYYLTPEGKRIAKTDAS